MPEHQARSQKDSFCGLLDGLGAVVGAAQLQHKKSQLSFAFEFSTDGAAEGPVSRGGSHLEVAVAALCFATHLLEDPGNESWCEWPPL